MSLHILSQVLIGPVVTEKTVRSGERENSYTFEVNPKATKSQIERAFKILFEDVEVVKISTVSVRGAEVRVGKTKGQKPRRKKAYIKLAPGHTINLNADNN